MKRISLILLLLAGSAIAQQGNTVTIQFPGAPTGTCSNIMVGLNTATGDYYNCLSGAWNKIATGGGSVLSGTITTSQIAKGTASQVIGPSSITDNGTTVATAETVTVTASGGSYFSGGQNPAVVPTVPLTVFGLDANPIALGTPGGTLGILGTGAAFGMFIGVADTGDTWFQSSRTDGVGAIFNMRLEPNGGSVFLGPNASVTNAGAVSGTTLVSTVAIGTAPLTVTSTTNVANLNASSLGGATFAAPGAIGGGTPSSGAFTTLNASGHVTFEGVTSTGATGSGKLVFDTGPTLSALAFSGSAPAVTTSGTTPYLNMNTLVKGAVNTCTFNFSTSSFTLAASPLSMCSPVYTLPNAALTWYYTCAFTWSVTAGTTPTLTFGQTFSQAPSVATEWQNIFTSNAGVSIQASQAVTTNSSMTATGSLTTAATLFQATIGGTFTASATSGTFSPTATLTGTGATGTLRGGCVIQ